jgi:hypothetical protein
LTPPRETIDPSLPSIAHWRPNFERLRLYGGAYGLYLVGGAITVLLAQRLSFWALILPVAGLLVVIAFNLWHPLYAESAMLERQP